MALIIVNPNPVFDRTITVNELIPGAVMRTLNVELTAGGKGINVARVLRAFGRPAPLIIPTGAQDRAHETKAKLVCRLLLAKKNPRDRTRSRMPSSA